MKTRIIPNNAWVYFFTIKWLVLFYYDINSYSIIKSVYSELITVNNNFKQYHRLTNNVIIVLVYKYFIVRSKVLSRNSIYKVSFIFSISVLHRLEKYTNDIIGNYQIGFIKSKSIIDNIF
jgi:hypothetical protein